MPRLLSCSIGSRGALARRRGPGRSPEGWRVGEGGATAAGHAAGPVGRGGPRQNFATIPDFATGGLSCSATSQNQNFAARSGSPAGHRSAGLPDKRKVLGAGGPRPVGVGERGQGLATTDGLSMRAGVPSGTQGDGPGRWPPQAHQPGGRTRVCQSGWRPAARRRRAGRQQI